MNTLLYKLLVIFMLFSFRGFHSAANQMMVFRLRHRIRLRQSTWVEFLLPVSGGSILHGNVGINTQHTASNARKLPSVYCCS
jgi:hypothetical protein